MKPNRTKCIWIACIALVALCTAMTTAYAGPPHDNLGVGYISNVTSTTNCVANTVNGGGNQFWDIAAGGTYTITLSGVTDCASQGQENSIGVIVHNSTGGNIGQSPILTATLVDSNVPGVYSFTVTLGAQCETMPIEYCTVNGQPGTGLMARDALQGTTGPGHLRIATFDANCNVTDNPLCQGQATPTPTPCTASIQACKFYDFNANGTKDTGEQLLGWPFCLTSITDVPFTPVEQISSDGSCTTFSNLGPGTYVVTEGTATGFFGSTISSTITIDHCGQTVTVNFGNYCTVPSGGLTLGYWSNKNGNKVLTGVTAGNGVNLLPAVTNLLNNPCGGGKVLVNSNGTLHTFTGTYADFKTWLLGATATNMAYMLSAQLATLKLDVTYGATIGAPSAVDGNAFDLCSSMTVNGLISAACDTLTGPGNQLTLSGNPSRPGQEMLKNCIDAINNNGAVVPVTPCNHSSASVPCGQ